VDSVQQRALDGDIFLSQLQGSEQMRGGRGAKRPSGESRREARESANEGVKDDKRGMKREREEEDRRRVWIESIQ
jgi:hypothetical protein